MCNEKLGKRNENRKGSGGLFVKGNEGKSEIWMDFLGVYVFL